MTLPPRISEAKMDEISWGNEYYSETMPTDMLEDIRDGIQSHPNINSREELHKLRDCIKQR